VGFGVPVVDTVSVGVAVPRAPGVRGAVGVTVGALLAVAIPVSDGVAEGDGLSVAAAVAVGVGESTGD
jgi:hypothetical protein